MIEILKFPRERERRSEISALLASEFDLANRLYRYWARIDFTKCINNSGLDISTSYAAAALNIQGARLFRSILEEASRSEAISSVSLSRSLFENAVAMGFILTPSIRIRPSLVKDQKTGAPKTDKFGNAKYVAKVRGNRSTPLSRELRAKLYMASPVLQEQAHALELSNKKGLKRYGKSQASRISKKIINQIEATIGPEWCSVLRGRNSYSGLDIKQTAALLGTTGVRAYQMLYPLQCRVAHAVEGRRMFTTDENGLTQATPFSHEGEVGLALYCATAFFIWGLMILDENISCKMKNTLYAFEKEAASQKRKT